MSVFQSTVRQLRHDDRVQRIGESVLLSPTDLTKHLGCEHITTLDLLATEGRAQPTQADDALELIFALGLSHEATYLRGLKDQGKEVLTIGAATAQVSRAQRERETVEAMRSGVDVIYQGTFYDGDWADRPIFWSGCTGPRCSETGPMRSRTPSCRGSSRCRRCCRWPPMPTG